MAHLISLQLCPMKPILYVSKEKVALLLPEWLDGMLGHHRVAPNITTNGQTSDLLITEFKLLNT